MMNLFTPDLVTMFCIVIWFSIDIIFIAKFIYTWYSYRTIKTQQNVSKPFVRSAKRKPKDKSSAQDILNVLNS